MLFDLTTAGRATAGTNGGGAAQQVWPSTLGSELPLRHMTLFLFRPSFSWYIYGFSSNNISWIVHEIVQRIVQRIAQRIVLWSWKYDPTLCPTFGPLFGPKPKNATKLQNHNCFIDLFHREHRGLWDWKLLLLLFFFFFFSLVLVTHYNLARIHTIQYRWRNLSTF